MSQVFKGIYSSQVSNIGPHLKLIQLEVIQFDLFVSRGFDHGHGQKQLGVQFIKSVLVVEFQLVIDLSVNLETRLSDHLVLIVSVGSKRLLGGWPHFEVVLEHHSPLTGAWPTW